MADPKGWDAPDDKQKTPWGFWATIGLAVLYLGYRLVEGLIALVRWMAG